MDLAGIKNGDSSATIIKKADLKASKNGLHTVLSALASLWDDLDRLKTNSNSFCAACTMDPMPAQTQDFGCPVLGPYIPALLRSCLVQLQACQRLQSGLKPHRLMSRGRMKPKKICCEAWKRRVCSSVPVPLYLHHINSNAASAAWSFRICMVLGDFNL